MASVAEAVLLPTPTEGVRPDLDPTGVPFTAMRDAENWIRRQGKFRVRPGFVAFASNPAQRPTAITQYTYHDLSTKVIMGTVAGWWRYNSGTDAWVDISGTALTASATQLQVFRVFSKAGATHLLGVNGKDSPKKWDGAAAAYSAMGGSPPIARCMMVVADRVILGNLSSGGTQSPVAIDVSALSDFDSGWGSVLVKVFGETPGEIMAMQELGYLQGAIYMDGAIALAIAQDGAVPFRFDFRKNVRGPVSSQAVAVLSEGVHAYLASDGAIYTFDGTQPRSLGYHIQRQIANTISPTVLGRSWVSWDPDQQILYAVYVPIGGSEPSRGVAITFPNLSCYPIRWSALTPSCGARLLIPSGITIGELVVPLGDIGSTLGELDTSVPRFVIGNVTGQAYEDTGVSDAGTAIPSYFETGLNDLGKRGTFKTVQEADHFFASSGGAQALKVRLGSSDYGEDRVLEADPTGTENEIDLADAGPRSTGHRLTGRLFCMRAEADATQYVEWLGSSVPVVMRGPR
jgi:hypothetical protein